MEDCYLYVAMRYRESEPERKLDVFARVYHFTDPLPEGATHWLPLPKEID